MTVHEVNTHQEFLQILNSSRDKLIIVDFSATWCGPCKKIAPQYEELSSQYPDVIFLKVDVEENEETAIYANVSSMPTFQTYRNGMKEKEVVGANLFNVRALILDDPWAISPDI